MSDQECPVTIPRDAYVMVTVMAVGFAEGAEIEFAVQSNIDGSVTIRREQQGAVLTLTASGPGSASVTVTASASEGDDWITTDSLTIQFVPHTAAATRNKRLRASQRSLRIPFHIFQAPHSAGYVEGKDWRTSVCEYSGSGPPGIWLHLGRRSTGFCHCG